LGDPPDANFKCPSSNFQRLFQAHPQWPES
jgi:hypothetical protein